MNRATTIPVQLVTGRLPDLDAETALLRLPANSGHGHPDGVHCVACAAQTDIRAHLYNLLHAVKTGARPAFSKVIVDASAVPDLTPLRAALHGHLPAQALRDHEVARTFRLAE